jgi:hypothetical protein
VGPYKQNQREILAMGITSMRSIMRKTRKDRVKKQTYRQDIGIPNLLTELKDK